MQQATPNAATAIFQLALPLVLSPISSHLAALHATRARLLHPADSSLAHTHCSHCGTPFLSSGGRIRSIRKRKKRKTSPSSGSDAVERVLRRSCRACGRDNDLPLDSSAHAPIFPKVRDRPRRNASAPPRASSVAPAVAAADPPPVPATAQHAPASQSHASRSLLPATASSASSRSSSLAPSAAPRPSPAPATKAEQIGAPQHGPGQPKARPKKKAGLQSLLARNREKQEQEKKREGQGQGLSAFLQGL
ncbi:hypothetical protein C8Q70DRAFT_1052821 [Cubamyces menziesii]|uniref:Rpr2-domain-containing protein n=1 Tax=Trametes cubensis TaxID=1111947 RepID=A0AAD7TVW8_9APHY|nr:hypothetical protein C8Q70DRAFT_1052821 [Cubamyces menziesii]KAJ8481763.1 hypothetical protein ONZ51_g5774 [Trametes cubensis]